MAIVCAFLLWLNVCLSLPSRTLNQIYRVMKTKIIVNYKGSGAKLCSNLSTVFKILFILSVLCSVVSLILILADPYNNYIPMLCISIGILLTSLISWAVLEALSSIAQTSLYERSVIKQNYDFEEQEETVDVKQEVRQILTKDFFQFERNE